MQKFKTRRIAVVVMLVATSAMYFKASSGDDSDSAINRGKYLWGNHFSSSSKSAKFLLLPLLRLSNSRSNNFFALQKPPQRWVNRLTQAWEISAILARVNAQTKEKLATLEPALLLNMAVQI